MRGPTIIRWAAVLVLASLSGCLEQASSFDSQSQRLEGTWQVQSIERSHGCPELGSLPPVDPGAVLFASQGDSWLVSHANGDATVLYRELEPGVWARSVNASYDGCDLQAESMWAFDRVIESRTTSMVLRLASNAEGDSLLVKLHDLLLPYREGNCDVSVRYVGDGAVARLSLGPEWAVRPSRELRDKLAELLGNNNIERCYAPRREIM